MSLKEMGEEWLIVCSGGSGTGGGGEKRERGTFFLLEGEKSVSFFWGFLEGRKKGSIFFQEGEKKRKGGLAAGGDGEEAGGKGSAAVLRVRERESHLFGERNAEGEGSLFLFLRRGTAAL